MSILDLDLSTVECPVCGAENELWKALRLRDARALHEMPKFVDLTCDNCLTTWTAPTADFEGVE